MSKLTLSVDESVVERAKRFAEKRGTSVSALVERYLAELTRAKTPTRSIEPGLASAPITARLSGLLRSARLDRRDHRRHLEEKFR